MAYSRQLDIYGQTGKVLLAPPENPVLFSQIFSGTPEFYAGSIVQVEETWQVLMVVDGETLVDTDFNWYFPKYYAGSYQILNSNSIPLHYPEDDGYLNSNVFNIKRYSNYTIVADPGTVYAAAEFSTIRACNFYLQPDVYIFPGENLPVTGFRDHGVQPAFLGGHSLSKAPLKDTNFNQLMPGMGLFLKPGITGVTAQYNAAVINTIRTDYPPLEAPTCQFAGGLSCDQEFAALIANGVSPSGETPIYDNDTSCPVGLFPLPRTFQCVDGGSRTYYACGGLP